jgi:glutamate/tyrosine decarboxylase-like PLP-dependent enzyme
MTGEYDEVLACAYEQALGYVNALGERRVAPGQQALDGLAAFDEPFPDLPSGAAETLRLLHTRGSPATLATAGGRFFGLVTGGALPVCVGAGWMANAWDQLALNAITSPIAAKLERVAAGWVLDVLGLPRHASVGFVTGTTMAHFTCLAAARAELMLRSGYDLRAHGHRSAPSLRIIVSEQIHVSALKVLNLLGFGSEELERVATDDQGRLRIDALPPLDERSIVLCQAGNVNSGAFDPIAEICERASAARAWVHVDGAFGLWARATPSLAHQARGIEHADSWTTDTHKWLNTPWDCGLAMCRHPQAVARVMSTQASYLAIGADAPTLVPEMGRRARGIEVWAALRTLGRAGLRDLIERCCAHARRFAEGLRALGFTILNDVVLNQVVATLADREQLARITAHVQASGECWFGPTHWRGTDAIRISVSSWRTNEADVRRSLAAIESALVAERGAPQRQLG